MSSRISALCTQEVLAATPAFLLIALGVLLDIAAVARLRKRPPDWGALCERLTVRGFPPAASASLVAALIAAASLAGAWMSAFGRMAQWDDRGICLGLLVQILSFHAIVLAGLMMIARRSRVTVSAAFGLSRPLRRHAGTAVILYAVSLPPIALASWLWSYFLLLAGITPDRQEIVNVFLQPGHAPMVYLGIAGMAVLMAPVFEEVVFRGLALPMLLKTCDRRLAVIAVSTVFACMHFHLPSIVPLFLVAFSLTLGYIFTGSLVTPVVMHFLFNLGSLLMYSSGAVLETADATAILPHIPPWTRAFASQP